MTCQLKAFVKWCLPLWPVYSCTPKSILQVFSRALRSWQPWERCVSFLEEFASGYSGGGLVKSATTLAPRLYVPWGRSHLLMWWDCGQAMCSVETSQCCYNTTQNLSICCLAQITSKMKPLQPSSPWWILWAGFIALLGCLCMAQAAEFCCGHLQRHLQLFTCWPLSTQPKEGTDFGQHPGRCGAVICTTFVNGITWKQSFSILKRAACPKNHKAMRSICPPVSKQCFAKTAASSSEWQMLAPVKGRFLKRCIQPEDHAFTYWAPRCGALSFPLAVWSPLQALHFWYWLICNDFYSIWGRKVLWFSFYV